MNCSPHDLRDYLFEELTPAQSGEVRAHLKTCAPCLSEVDNLRSTQTALLALRDEEMPQRIGFVSDKVFEPSPFRRWLAGFWNSTARIGFVSSTILAGAILVHAFVQVHNPAQSVHNAPAQPVISQVDISNEINKAVDARVNQAVNQAVAQAVAESEARAQKRTTALLVAAQKRFDQERWPLLSQTEQSRYLGFKHNAEMVRANFVSAQ